MAPNTKTVSPKQSRVLVFKQTFKPKLGIPSQSNKKGKKKYLDILAQKSDICMLTIFWNQCEGKSWYQVTLAGLIYKITQDRLRHVTRFRATRKFPI